MKHGAIRPIVFLSLLATGMAGTAAEPPLRVDAWAPIGISSPQFESHPAFDPRNGDFYFVRSAPDFRGWRILFSHCGQSGWTTPQPAPFAGDGVEADPGFAPDGDTLYFISTRTTDGRKNDEAGRKDLDIWRVRRDARGGWSTPQRLPEPVNSGGPEWFPRATRDGWLYFGSNRPGGIGGNDIWRARETASGKWIVENAGKGVNTPGDEYEPLPSPDGRYMILMADNGLYRSERIDTGWSPRVRLPAPVNVNGSEIGALFSPSGNSLLYARDLKGDKAGEFFVWHIDGDEAWPPACPAGARQSTGR